MWKEKYIGCSVSKWTNVHGGETSLSSQCEGHNFNASLCYTLSRWLYPHTFCVHKIIHDGLKFQKQQSKNWKKHTGSLVTKELKNQPSASKMMLSIFCNMKGVILCHYLEKSTNYPQYQLFKVAWKTFEIHIKRSDSSTW